MSRASQARAVAAAAARTWWIDPVNGSDTAGTGRKSAPLKTCAKVITVAADFDEVRFVPHAIITEQWGMTADGGAATYNKPLRWRGTAGAPAIFQNFDRFAGSWTLATTYTKVFQATVTHLWGGAGSKIGAGQGLAPSVLIDATRLTEVQLQASPAAGDNAFATEAACLAYVEATPGTFYVRGKNSSSMVVGWEAGDQTYFVHGPADDTPAGHTVSIAQRLAPIFSEGSELSDFVIFGGVGHNGVILRACRVDRVDHYFPCHHTFMCAGADMTRCRAIGANQTHGGYAYHSYNATGGSTAKLTTRLRQCEAIDYYGTFNALFGCHGTVASGQPVIDFLEVDDFFGYNVHGLGTGGANLTDITRGAVFRRPRLFNCLGISIETNAIIEDPVIVQGTMNGAACWVAPAAGATVQVFGGSTQASKQNAISASGTAGKLQFTDHLMLVEGDPANNRWIQNTGTHQGISFTRCILASEGGRDQRVAYGVFSSDASSAYTLTDCHLSGLSFAGAAGTVSMANTSYGGRHGLHRARDGAIELDADNLFQQLGDVVKGIATFNVNNFGNASQTAFVLTSKSVYWLGSNLNSESPFWTIPAGVTLNGITMVTGSTNHVLMFGLNGTLYKLVNNSAASSIALVNTGGRTTNWIAAVNTMRNASTGTTWLLGDDGSITEYNALTDTFTTRTSGVAYPLTGGYQNGATIVVWGGNSVGSGAGSAGGVRVSTDSGATWAASLTNGDSTPASIGTFAYRIRCATFINGFWVLFGTNGTMLTSTTAASGSWTSRSFRYDIDARVCVGDTIWGSKQVLVAGDAIASPYARDNPLILLDTSPSASDPTLWTAQRLASPHHGIGALGIIDGYQGGSAAKQWVALGKVARFAMSEDAKAWAKGAPLSLNKRVVAPLTEASKVQTLLPA